MSSDPFAVALADADYAEICRVGCHLASLENATRAQRLTHIAALSSHGESLDADGHRGVTDWLCAELGLSLAEANELTRVANKLDLCPRLFERFAQGELSWNRFALITTGLDDTYDEEYWLENERRYSNAQIALIIKHNQHRATDSEGAFRGRLMTARKHGTYGTIYVKTTLDFFDTIVGAVDRIALRAKAEDETIEYPPIEHSRHDALVEICSLSTPSGREPDKVMVFIHAPVALLNPAYYANLGEGGHTRHAELGDDLLSNETFQRLACDARFRVIQQDRSGNTVGIGKVSRTIPRWLRRLVHQRDRGCAFPGCHKTRWTDIHHIRFWGEGGPTNLDNLIELCVAHHHYVHDLGWSIQGNPEAGPVRFLNRDGRWLRPGGWADNLERATHAHLDDIVPADNELLRAALGLPPPQTA